MGEKITVLRPEMSGRILDESHFHFHVTCKAKIVNAVNKLRQGKDFLKTLMSMGFRTDKRWTKNTANDPNVRVLLEILEEYKKLEHRPSRSAIIAPIIEYAIALYASDLFYRERGEWFLTRIIERSPEMRFFTIFTDPNRWYPKGRNIGIDEESPDAPTITEEYKLWYGVDVENPVISYDMMQEMIRQQRIQYEKEIGNDKWAEEELAKCT